MKNIQAIIISGTVMLCAWGFSACSSKGEQAEVKEETEQIEEAHIAGRDAARSFINQELADSMDIHAEMLRAGAKRAKYDSLPQCRAAFDSAFISTVRTVNPDIASRLEAQRPK